MKNFFLKSMLTLALLIFGLVSLSTSPSVSASAPVEMQTLSLVIEAPRNQLTDSIFSPIGLALADTLDDIGEVLTDVMTWFSTILTAIETALATSILLQIGLALTAVFVGFKVLGLVVRVIKSFIR